MENKLLTINEYSRPGTKIGKIKNIVIHWVGNANSTAIANRNYFESLKNKHIYASAHYVIGLEGEIIKCVPENEVAYHAKQANNYSIGIECCHPDWNGKFNDKTYKSLIELCVDLCKRYNLNPEIALIRHYDVTKKVCPKYYVENPKAWSQLKIDVNNAMSDSDLIKAVDVLHKKGIINTPSAWYDANNIKLEYVPALLKNMGGLDRLIKDHIINDRLLWQYSQYKPTHVRSLIIKYSKLA